MKIQMESLLNGKTIEVNFDEQIVFSHLAQDESAVWSLLVAGGYLKVEDVDVMNYCMNKITLATFSYFDVGSEGAGNQEPERFYHGFVLGLIADQTDIKVRNIKREESLEDTVQTALTQIKEKCYDAELYDRGLKKEEIHHYGFAFEGKKVLIG